MKKLIWIAVALGVIFCAVFAQADEFIDAAGLKVSPDETVLDFDAAGIDVTDAAVLAAAIEQLPQLTEVRAYESTMDQGDMEKLFDQYPDVFLGFTIHIGPHAIRTDVTAFSTLHMASPTKDDPRHTSEELSVIRMCKNLKALDLGHNQLTNVDFLYDLPGIEVLILSPNERMLTDISPIAACENLVYLECFNTPMTDLTPLANLTKLRDLNLARCNLVTDISPLYDLPNLERFWCGSMDSVPTEQLNIMREKHPGMIMRRTYDPTDGGWRDHPHQKEQMAFFRTGVYVPFSE